MLCFCLLGVIQLGIYRRRILSIMKLLLTLCACAALFAAFWATNIFVWLLVGLGIICALSLGVVQQRQELACLIASTFFLVAGFTSLKVSITNMAAGSLEPQVTTFAGPVVTVLMSSLLFCIAMVERHAILSSLHSDQSARRSTAEATLDRRSH